jgi:zinc transporter ZupT
MSNFEMLDSCSEYLEECRIHHLGWVALLALSAHSFIDGVNLGASFSAGERAGFAVGLALALHKVADGFTLTSLFGQAGYTHRRSLALLTFVALTTPVGAFLAASGYSHLPASAEAALLGFAAGSFIYIAAADILPRIHKNRDLPGLAYFCLGLFGLAALRIL